MGPGQSRDTIAFGSPGYAPPEQYGKAQTTPRAAIYALGATLHQLLTGDDPSHTPFRFAPLQLRSQTTPVGLDALITSMLEIDEKRRPASMHAIKLELQRFVAQRTVRQVGILVKYYGHSDRVRSVDWSPDGAHIVSAGVDKTAQVWEALTGDHLFTYRNHSDWVRALAWSPDGKRIASAGDDQTVHVWNLTCKKPILIYRDHADGLHAVDWSPDGKYIASSAGSSIDYYADNSVRIWDAASGDTIYIFRSHSDYVLALAWSPNGQQIASASSDHSVSVWRAR